MQSSAAPETLMASRPMERTAFRTKSISTSVAYLWVRQGSQMAGSGSHALVKFRENLPCIALPGQSVYYLEFGEFNIDRVVVLAEEHLDIVFEDCRAALDD